MCQIAPHPVPALAEFIEQMRDFGMFHRTAFRIGQQILLADIGDIIRFVVICEQMVKRLVAAGAYVLRNRFVPFFAVRKNRIAIKNNPSEIEHLVPHDISNSKVGAHLARRLDFAPGSL